MDAVKLFFLENNCGHDVAANCSFNVAANCSFKARIHKSKEKEQEKRQRDIEKLNLWL